MEIYILADTNHENNMCQLKERKILENFIKEEYSKSILFTELLYVGEDISKNKKKLNHPLISFCIENFVDFFPIAPKSPHYSNEKTTELLFTNFYCKYKELEKIKKYEKIFIDIGIKHLDYFKNIFELNFGIEPKVIIID